MITGMNTATLMDVEEYLKTGFRPDCDFIDGEVLERNLGTKSHGYAQIEIGSWFVQRKTQYFLQPISELRMQVAQRRFRIPDVALVSRPMPEEEVVTTPPCICVEVMSPDDTMAGLQDRLDDYLAFGVPNIWVIDPVKHRGWRVTAEGWARATDNIMRTADNRVEMPLADVLLR